MTLGLGVTSTDGYFDDTGKPSLENTASMALECMLILLFLL